MSSAPVKVAVGQMCAKNDVLGNFETCKLLAEESKQVGTLSHCDFLAHGLFCANIRLLWRVAYLSRELSFHRNESVVGETSQNGNMGSLFHG